MCVAFVLGLETGDDFFIDDKSVTIRQNTGTSLHVTFVADRVALEPDETFQLRLSSNPPPPAGSFFLNNLDVTIQDPDGKVCTILMPGEV